jgi:hypothetical protein
MMSIVRLFGRVYFTSHQPPTDCGHGKAGYAGKAGVTALRLSDKQDVTG